MKSKSKKFLELVREHIDNANEGKAVVLLNESPFKGRTDISVVYSGSGMTDLFSFELNGDDISNIIIYGKNIKRHYENIRRQKAIFGIPVSKVIEGQDAIQVVIVPGVIPALDL